MNRSLPLAGRRIGQTLRSFDNGPAVLTGLAAGRVLGRPAELSFRLSGGGTITCPNRAGARVPVYEVFADDAYRLPSLLSGLDPDPVVLDIGAHIGCFTVALARACRGARVHAYEASPTTAAYLRRNVAANGLGDRVEAHNVALADEPGSIDLADNAGGSALNGLTSDGTATVRVQAVTFADAVAGAGGAVDLVKIDTEGAEYDIVLGSDPASWSSVRRVVLEFHPVPRRSWDELEEFFAAAGLRVVDRKDETDVAQGTVWLSRDPMA